MFATSSSWKLLFLFSPSPYHFLGWWPTKLLLSCPCVMPVTLNRTQYHSNNSLAFAPWAVEVIDLNLNNKGLTETLFPKSCLLCGSLFLWGNLPQEVSLVPSCAFPWPCSIWCSGDAIQSFVFLKSFQVIQGQPRLRTRASSDDWFLNPVAHCITQEMIKDSVFWVPLPEVLI